MTSSQPSVYRSRQPIAALPSGAAPWSTALSMAMQTPWIAYHRPLPQPRLRLFCFHHAGGAASVFRPWRDLLQPYEIELCPIQLPGRETRTKEPLQTALKPLVTKIGQALIPYTDLPFACLGHSMGALVAFYVALYLQQRGHTPKRLLISAATPPQTQQPQQPIHDLPDAAFLAAVDRYNGLPRELRMNPEAMALLLPILRADFAASANCHGMQQSLLHCPVSVFSGLYDRTVSETAVGEWQQQTVAAVKVRKFPGDHFFLYRQTNLVIRAIVQDLYSTAW